MLGHRAAGIVALPETAVEDRSQTLLERGGIFGRVLPALDGAQGRIVALHHALDILGPAGAALDLQHAYARLQKAVQKIYRTQILRREDIASVHGQLAARLHVGDGIFAAAYLAARPAVGRAPLLVLAQVALARNRHAQRPVGEHLDTHGTARRPRNAARLDLARDMPYLRQAQLPRQNHDIGPLRVELHRLGVRDVALRRYVHLQPRTPRAHDGRDVRRDNGIDTHLRRTRNDRRELLHLAVIDDRIDREVCPHAVFVRRLHDARHVVKAEIGRRPRPHVQRPHTEIYGIGTRVDGRLQRLVTPRGGHDLNVRSLYLQHICSSASLTR